jgi:uncharacterized protein
MPDPSLPGIERTEGGVCIRVYASPRASANSILGLHNGEVKVALVAPPVEGAANRALIEFLAKKLGVPRGAVTLISGETSRHKRVQVEGIDTQTALSKLGLADM